MLSYIAEKREEINRFMNLYIHERKMKDSAVNRWGSDVASRIEKFISGGKMIRGALVFFGNDLCGGSSDVNVLRCAAAAEFFQSYLLIHDDIMDRDMLRRGEPSVYNQYASVINGNDDSESMHFGESMGICAGDIAAFYALSVLNMIDLDPEVKTDIISLFSEEMINVGLGQMQDIYFSHSRKEATTEEVLKLYMYKTSRYTFSLPLASGALIAGSVENSKYLFDLGVFMGLIFQIRDDELGTFGESCTIGKVAGSDIREGKMTVLMTELFKAVDGANRDFLADCLGNRDLLQKDVERIRGMMLDCEIDKAVKKIKNDYAVKCTDIIGKMKIENEYREKLAAFLEYNLSRQK